MAIDKKRAEQARKSQLEGFINTQPGTFQEESGKIMEQTQHNDSLEIATAEKSGKEKKSPDYIRLDVSGLKEYLQTMAGYDSIRYGKTVSVTKYIRALISADMDSRKEEYEKIKNI